MAARVGARDTAGGQARTAMADFFQPPYFGTPDPDEMFGTAEGEVFYGEEGADNIFGEGGGDRIDGGDHNGTLLGGDGADTLVGGPGADTFIFRQDEVQGSTDTDTIVDWDPFDIDEKILLCGRIDLDAFVANDGDNRVWENQGGAQGGTAGVFQDSGQALGNADSKAGALGDLDADGDVLVPDDPAWIA
jgi:Ca2+-binding RTX toxin-like protein